MRCPSCGHERTSPHLRCSNCSATFPRELLERYDRLTFLLGVVSDWERAGRISESARAEIAEPCLRELERVEQELGVRAAPPVPEALVVPVPVAPVPPAPTVAHGLIPAAPASSVPPEGALPEGGPPEVAPSPPRPLIPRISWEDVWRGLLSERSLEVLLFAGAVLIIAAAGTFVYFNWGRFPPALQLLSLIVGTASFFVGGWLLRTRWRLTQSAPALVGIGAFIVPVDFYAWARFRDVPPSAYAALWCTASICCGVVYAATTWWLRHWFFCVLLLLAAHSLALAVLFLLGVPPAWWGAVAAALATVWMVLRPRFSLAGPGSEQAATGVSIVAAVLGVAVPALLQAEKWGTLFDGTSPAGAWILPVAAAVWMGAVFLFAFHRRLPSGDAATLAALTPAVAVVMTLLPMMTRPWVSLGILILAAVYVALEDRVLGSLAPAMRGTAIGASLVAVAWSLMDRVTAAVVVLAASALYAWWAFEFRRPVVLIAAQIAALVGLLYALAVARVAVGYWPLAGLAVAAVSLAGTVAARAAPGFARVLYVGAYVFPVLGIVATVDVKAPALVLTTLLGGALAIAVYSAVLVHRGSDPALSALAARLPAGGGLLFQWVAAALAAAEVAVAWLWWRPVPHGLAAAWLTLGTGFVLIGRRLRHIDPRYLRPWAASALVLSTLATVLALVVEVRAPLIYTLLLATVTSALWAWLLRSPWLAYVAAGLLLVPFGLALPDAVAHGLIPSRAAYTWLIASLGAVYLLAGVILDRSEPRFGAPVHLVSHLLIPFSLVWVLQEPPLGLQTLAIAVAFYVASARLVHEGRHPTVMSLIDRLTQTAPGAAPPLRAIFVYVSAWLFPFWFELAAVRETRAFLGVTAAALAWAYLMVGQWIRRANPAYVPPFRIAAQALVIAGGLLAVEHRPLLLGAVALGAGLQVALYALSGQTVWVYTAALGGAGWLGLALNHLHFHSAPAGWVMILLGIGYVGLAEVNWRRTATRDVPPVSAALLAVAFLVVVIGILLTALRVPENAWAAYAVSALLFLWCGWRLREPLLGYPAAGLAAATYVAVQTTLLKGTGASTAHHGVALLPGVAVFFAVAWALDRRAAAAGPPSQKGAWSTPMDAAAQIGMLVAVVFASTHRWLFPASLGLAAVLYGLSAVRFRRPVLVYAALLAALASALFALLQAPIAPRYIPVAFVPVAWALAFIGWRTEAVHSRQALFTMTWAQPWHVAALATVALWELVGMIEARAQLLTSLGFAALLCAYAFRWREWSAATAAQVLVVLGIGGGLRWLQVTYPAWLAAASLTALAFGVLSVILGVLRRGALWQTGARGLAHVLAAGALVWAFLGVVAAVHAKAGEGLVYTLAIVGLLYLLLAIKDRQEWLGYLAVAMLELAWGLFLLRRLQVTEIQAYAIPSSLYLLGIGVVERRMRRPTLARFIEVAGLILLLGSAFWQSVTGGGFWYAVLLAVEAVAVAWAGAAWRLRHYFFSGIGMLLVNVVAQVIDPLRALDKTILFLSLGVLLVLIAVAAERKREAIIRTTREWRSRLEAWE